MRFPPLLACLGLLAVPLVTVPVLPARAALVNVAPGTFTQNTSTVTFGTLDDDATFVRSYTVAPGLTVSFGSYFVGQQLTTSAADGGLYYLTGTTLSTSPTLVSNGDAYTVITTDGSTADPTNERLAGAAPYQFLGPVSILFSSGVKEVTFTAGVFSEASDLTIQAYAADGTSLGSLSNTADGDGRFHLADDAGRLIQGLSLYIPDGSLNGFSIDDVSASATLPTSVPEPGTLSVFVAGLLAGAAVLERFRARS